MAHVRDNRDTNRRCFPRFLTRWWGRRSGRVLRLCRRAGFGGSWIFQGGWEEMGRPLTRLAIFEAVYLWVLCTGCGRAGGWRRETRRNVQVMWLINR